MTDSKFLDIFDPADLDAGFIETLNFILEIGKLKSVLRQTWLAKQADTMRLFSTKEEVV